MEPQRNRVDASAAQEPTSPTEFKVFASIGQRIGELALGGVLGLEGLLWLSPEPQFAVYQWFFLPFCTLGSLHFLFRAFDRRPRLTVDADGVTDRSALLLGPLHLEWDEVVDVTRPRLAGGVEIVVRDLEDVRNRAGAARKAWIWLRRLVGKRTILITPTFLGMKKQELEGRLRAALDGFQYSRLVKARGEIAGEVEGGTGPEESGPG